MGNESKEARERIKNTLIRNLPRDKYDNDVSVAEESDLRGYNIHLHIGRITDDLRGQVRQILEETNPHLYNRTNYDARAVKIDNPRGHEVHIRMVPGEKRE